VPVSLCVKSQPGICWRRFSRKVLGWPPSASGSQGASGICRRRRGRFRRTSAAASRFGVIIFPCTSRAQPRATAACAGRSPHRLSANVLAVAARPKPPGAGAALVRWISGV